MNISELANLIIEELNAKFHVETILKGSLGYGAFDEASDIDIQLDLDDPALLQKIADYFNAELSKVQITHEDGNSFDSYKLEFNREGYDISLFYDTEPRYFDRVGKIVKSIAQMSKRDRHVVKLTTEGYKYLHEQAAQDFVKIFNVLCEIMDPQIVQEIEEGKRIDKHTARVIKRTIQAIYVNDTNVSYRKKFLEYFSNLKSMSNS